MSPFKERQQFSSDVVTFSTWFYVRLVLEIIIFFSFILWNTIPFNLTGTVCKNNGRSSDRRFPKQPQNKHNVVLVILIMVLWLYVRRSNPSEWKNTAVDVLWSTLDTNTLERSVMLKCPQRSLSNETYNSQVSCIWANLSSLSVLVYEEKADYGSKMLLVKQARLTGLVSVRTMCRDFRVNCKNGSRFKVLLDV